MIKVASSPNLDNGKYFGLNKQPPKRKAIPNKERLKDPKAIGIYINKYNKVFLEDFELLEKIGTGMESIVFKTLLKKNKRIVTTKIIFREKGEKMNLKEINNSNKLKNKNIIDFYGASTLIENKIDYIMMEYAKYGNIRDFQLKILKRSVLSESLILFFTSQILNGLKYLHICKIVHLDIKPQNIIIDDFLNIKIIDFSISINYDKVKSNKIQLPFRGTNFYIAPEVINMETIEIKDLNKIDLYSLGVLIYNLAFGYYPYDLKNEDSKDYNKIYEKIRTNELDLDNDNDKGYYSKYFIDFLRKLLEKDINKRINIYEALNHYWVKGAEILFDEKEKIYNATSFLSYLITDNFKNFNDYINM